MALMPGTKLGPYEIAGAIGAGGMGEVYRGRDMRLARDVALKVLPESFAEDAQRMARFEREAKVLASLSHPNIAAIFGLEESGKMRALVLELVEGPTLADRIKPHGIPLDEALPIAKQICEAMEYAHERGIVHRDLKPSNIKVAQDGQVKVLDFGLAKALEGETASSDLSNSPTLSGMATQAGIILGTAAYMSPEQAKGKSVDRRADIWAFGCVLYEMLMGEAPFGGDSAAETLAAVLKEEPSLDRLPSATPATIQKLLGRCLDKSPRQRLRDIGEARIAIERVLAGAPEEVEAGVRPAQTKANWRIIASVAALTAVLAGLATLWWGSTPADLPLLKLEIPVENLDLGMGQPFSLSPDGKKIAFIGNGRLWIRFLDQLEARQVPNSEGALQVAWSPDSSKVAFATAHRISKILIRGGEPIMIADVPGEMSAAAGLAWEANDQILFTTGFTGLLEVSSQGGNPVPVLDPAPNDEADFHGCSLLPNGQGIIFVIHRKVQGPDTIAVFSGKTSKTLLTLPGDNLFGAVYSPTGHILFRQSSTTPGLWAVPFSLARLEVTGKPFLVAPDAGFPSSSSTGILAYVAGANAQLTQLIWVDRSGKILGTVGPPAVQAAVPSLSPDESRVAVAAQEKGPNTEVWIQDVTRGTRTLLARDSTNYHFTFPPSWTPEGNRIAYQMGNNQTDLSIAVKAADGTGNAQMLVKGVSGSFSRDGKYLFFSSWDDEKEKWSTSYLSLQGGGKAVPVLEPGSTEAVLSPDGHSLAYASNETGRSEVYVRAFPTLAARLQVSVNGGDWPHWNRRGDELYFAEGNDIMVVEIKTSPKLALSPPRKLFTRQLNGIGSASGRPDGFDVTGDGKRFLLLQDPSNQATGQSIVIVQNWFAEFQHRTDN